MKSFSIILLVIIFCSCSKLKSGNEKFAYSRFPISKGALGPIKIGSHISQNKKHLKDLDATAVDAFLYHYDGGGNAYDYSYKGRRLFALIPARDTESNIAIMVLDNNFKTKRGISTKSSIRDILQYNPNMRVFMDLPAGGEVMTDEKNDLSFIFETNEDSLIAIYTDIDAPGNIMHADAVPAWITII